MLLWQPEVSTDVGNAAASLHGVAWKGLKLLQSVRANVGT